MHLVACPELQEDNGTVCHKILKTQSLHQLIKRIFETMFVWLQSPDARTFLVYNTACQDLRTWLQLKFEARFSRRITVA